MAASRVHAVTIGSSLAFLPLSPVSSFTTSPSVSNATRHSLTTTINTSKSKHVHLAWRRNLHFNLSMMVTSNLSNNSNDLIRQKGAPNAQKSSAGAEPWAFSSEDQNDDDFDLDDDDVDDDEEDNDLESDVDDDDAYNNEDVQSMSSVKSARAFRPSSGRSSLVDEPDENDDDIDDVDDDLFNPMTEQASFDDDDQSPEDNILDDDEPQGAADLASPSQNIQQARDEDEDDIFADADAEGEEDVDPELLDSETEEDVKSAAELLSERGLLGLGVDKSSGQSDESVRKFALDEEENDDDIDEEPSVVNPAKAEQKKSSKASPKQLSTTIDYDIDDNNGNDLDEDGELDVADDLHKLLESNELGEDLDDDENEEKEDTRDDTGLTSINKFGHVWELNEDAYVTITEPGEAFSYELDVEDQEDQDMASMRRGKQGGWSGGLASYSSTDLEEGSREWIARKSYELMTQASYKDMYRWTKWHQYPPQEIVDLYPKEPETPSCEGIAYLEMSLPPPMDPLVGSADPNADIVFDEEEEENNRQSMSAFSQDSEYSPLYQDNNSARMSMAKQRIQQELVDEQIEEMKRKLREKEEEEEEDDGTVAAGGLKITAEKATKTNMSSIVKTGRKRRGRARTTEAPPALSREREQEKDEEERHLESSVKFPCDYKFKVEGEDDQQFVQSIKQVVEQNMGISDFPMSSIHTEEVGNFTRATLTVRVESAKEIINLYDSLRASPSVKFSYG